MSTPPNDPTLPYPAPAPDTRPKGVAWTALILAAVGIVLSLIGFVPVVWLGLISVIIGGVLLLAALVVSIIGLAGGRHGGKAISVTALVLTVLGALVGSVALVVALVFTGLTLRNSGADVPPAGVGSTPQASPTPSGDASDPATDADVAAGEAAFLADVRPQVNEIMTEIDASITPDMVAAAFPDEALLTMGRALLVTGEAGIDPLVSQAQASIGDTVSADQLRDIFETIYQAAEANLK